MTTEQAPDGGPLLDRAGRPLRDLRLSVTDRCNFRCRYCMPRELFGPDHAFLPREQLLSFEELTTVTSVFARLGVTKVRLTGGEPLLRRGLPALVRSVAAVPGIADLAMTTNGSLLADAAGALAEAGLRRVTVSLDSLDEATFAAMSDTRVPVAQVLGGIAAARAAGLPVKVNTVLKRGVNDGGLLALAGWAREAGLPLRVIEYMDVGATNGWRMQHVVPSAEVLDRIGTVWPLEPVEPATRGEVAQRWRYVDGGGELGVISSVTQPFCADCTRARVTAVGELFTCLFATRGTDLRALLRGPDGEAALERAVRDVWAGRSDRYSELRGSLAPAAPGGTRAEMSYLGG
ncbi:MAG: moaA [Mycobacterium sp.]|nr:moaA [Mycobacterium sp.]